MHFFFFAVALARHPLAGVGDSAAQADIKALVGNKVPSDLLAYDADGKSYAVAKQEGEILITVFKDTKAAYCVSLLNKLADVDNRAPHARLFTICCTPSIERDRWKGIQAHLVGNSVYKEPLFFAEQPQLEKELGPYYPVQIIVDGNHIVQVADYVSKDQEESGQTSLDSKELANTLETMAKTSGARQDQPIAVPVRPPLSHPGPTPGAAPNSKLERDLNRLTTLVKKCLQGQFSSDQFDLDVEEVANVAGFDRSRVLDYERKLPAKKKYRLLDGEPPYLRLDSHDHTSILSYFFSTQGTVCELDLTLKSSLVDDGLLEVIKTLLNGTDYIQTRF